MPCKKLAASNTSIDDLGIDAWKLEITTNMVASMSCKEALKSPFSHISFTKTDPFSIMYLGICVEVIDSLKERCIPYQFVSQHDQPCKHT